MGYAKDRFAGAALEKADPAVFEKYQAEETSQFLFFSEVSGLDGKKLGDVQTKLADARAELGPEQSPEDALAALTDEERLVHASSITGDRETLVADSLIPATMAVIYLILLIYFKVIGGYRPVHIAADFTGGTEGPMEA